MPRNRGTLLGFMSFREFKGFSVELAGLTVHLKEAESFQAWEMFASGLLESTKAERRKLKSGCLKTA
jgi:hypothetical protein